MFRTFLAACAALILSTTFTFAGEPTITILKTRTDPPIVRQHEREIPMLLQRHLPTGSLGEISGSAIRCQNVDELLAAQLRPGNNETFVSVLDELNLWINRESRFDFDQKYELFVDLKVPEDCLFTVTHANATSDEVVRLVIRTGTEDWILLDNIEPVEGGAISAWRDVMSYGGKEEYGWVTASDGRSWEINQH